MHLLCVTNHNSWHIGLSWGCIAPKRQGIVLDHPELREPISKPHGVQPILKQGNKEVLLLHLCLSHLRRAQLIVWVAVLSLQVWEPLVNLVCQLSRVADVCLQPLPQCNINLLKHVFLDAHQQLQLLRSELQVCRVDGVRRNHGRQLPYGTPGSRCRLVAECPLPDGLHSVAG